MVDEVDEVVEAATIVVVSIVETKVPVSLIQNLALWFPMKLLLMTTFTSFRLKLDRELLPQLTT